MGISCKVMNKARMSQSVGGSITGLFFFMSQNKTNLKMSKRFSFGCFLPPKVLADEISLGRCSLVTLHLPTVAVVNHVSMFNKAKNTITKTGFDRLYPH